MPKKNYSRTYEERKSSVLLVDCLCQQSWHVWKYVRCEVFLRHEKTMPKKNYGRTYEERKSSVLLVAKLA